VVDIQWPEATPTFSCRQASYIGKPDVSVDQPGSEDIEEYLRSLLSKDQHPVAKLSLQSKSKLVEVPVETHIEAQVEPVTVQADNAAPSAPATGTAQGRLPKRKRRRDELSRSVCEEFRAGHIPADKDKIGLAKLCK
jgi:hypothetical protein